jgi:hypothetical protein
MAATDEHLPRMQPATSPMNPVMRCRECSWQGERLEAYRAAVNADSGSFVAACPACGTFNLEPVR